MKFAFKLSIGITLLIAAILAVGGIITVNRNFSYAMENAVDQNVRQLSVERYALEQYMRNLLLSGEDYNEDKLAENADQMARYADGQLKLFGVYAAEENRRIYSSLPTEFSAADIRTAIDRSGDVYLIRRAGDETYMLLSTDLKFSAIHSARLLGAYDITQMLNDRNRQIQNQLLLNGVLILLSAAIVLCMALLLTAPFGRLEQASRKIAAGAYGERIRLKSRDEIGRFSQSFNQMAEAVEQKIGELNDELRRRDDFIAAFSHEIKTPMTAVMGYAGLLRHSPCTHEQQFTYADVIYREGRRLEELSRKLMDIMMLTTEDIELSPTEMEPLLQRVSEQLRPVLEDIDLEVDAQEAWVMAQPALLDSLLRNLIVNARRAEPADRRIVVRGRLMEGEGVYRLSVSDTGCGIPEADLHRVTEPFYMVDKSRSRARGGAGLGLYLCSRIARAHRSGIHIDSKLDEGTTVWLNLEVTGDDRNTA